MVHGNRKKTFQLILEIYILLNLMILILLMTKDEGNRKVSRIVVNYEIILFCVPTVSFKKFSDANRSAVYKLGQLKN